MIIIHVLFLFELNMHTEYHRRELCQFNPPTRTSITFVKVSSSQLERNQYITLIIHHENRNVLTRSLSRNSLSFIIPVCLYSLDIRCYRSITQLLMVLGFSLFSLSISINKTKKKQCINKLFYIYHFSFQLPLKNNNNTHEN